MKIFIASSFRDTWNSVRPEAEMFLGLAARGHEVTIATHGDSAYCSRFREAGIKILDVYPTRKVCLSTIRTYRRELGEGRYDIAYAMNSKTIPNVAFAAIGLPVKFVTYRGSTSGLYRHDPTAYLTHLHPRVDAICCASKAIERYVRRRIWRRSVTVVTVYKGHDISWFSNERSELEEFSIPPSAFVIACVANARPVKGIDILVNATDAVMENPDVHVLIVGRGVTGSPYATIRAGKSASSRIHLVEHRSDVLRLVSAATVYVQPSLNEGLPKAVIEAMAQSVPVIATDAGGMPELVVHGETGWIVERGSVRALSDALQLAYQSRERLSGMGRQARIRIEREFSLERAIDGHISLFESLLSRPAAGKTSESR